MIILKGQKFPIKNIQGYLKDAWNFECNITQQYILEMSKF